MHAISAFNQDTQGGVEILALIGPVEGIGEQHDLMAICGPKTSASALNTSRRNAGRARFALMPANFSNSARSNGLGTSRR